MKFDQASGGNMFGVGGDGRLVTGCEHPQLELWHDEGAPAIVCARCTKQWPMRGGPAWGGPKLPASVAKATIAVAGYEAPEHAQKLTDFDQAYERLSAEGACDDPGGMEWERVRAEWIAAGQPEIDPFIRRRANVAPGSDGQFPPAEPS